MTNPDPPSPSPPPCNHDTDPTLWEPVPQECGRYQCRTCQAYGRRVLRDGEGPPGTPRGTIVAWPDGQLRRASAWSPTVRRDPRVPTAGTMGPRAYRSRITRPGEKWLDPPTEPK